MSIKEILTVFYTHFSKANSSKMLKYYAEDVEFYDPAFGSLTGQKPYNMWKMLLGRFDEHTKISFEIIEIKENIGTVGWKAEYHFGKNRNKVINHVTSTLTLKGGKTVKHHDQFDLWKWSSQAIGITGKLLGWSKFMQNKIRATTNNMLNKYIAKHA